VSTKIDKTSLCEHGILFVLMEFSSNVRIPNKNTWKKQGDERLFVFIWANFISVKKSLVKADA